MTRRFAAITDRVAGLGGDRWDIHRRALDLAANGRDVLFLSIGDPDMPTPEPVVDVAVRSLRAGRTSYSNGRGEASMLEALASHYSIRTGRSIATEQAIFLPGTQTALALSMLGLVDPGDDVLVPEPYYATYEGVVRMAGGRLVPVPLDPERGFHLDAEVLAGATTDRARVLLLNSPHNPTGATLSAEEITAIGEVCIDRNLWIVADEVYAGLAPDGVFASPFDQSDLADRTVVVSSVSKSHAMTGWRCGWIMGPQDVTVRILPVAESLLFGSQPFLQDAAAHALLAQTEATREMRSTYQRRARLVAEVLGRSPAIRSRVPEAGIFMMVDVRATQMSGTDFALRLLDEASVAVMPGESFGPSAGGHVRVSLTNEDAVLLEGARRIGAVAEELANELPR